MFDLDFSTYELWIQALGFVAFAISISSYQFKEQRKMFGMRVCSDMIWTVHYFLLGAITPALAVAVAFSRTFLVVFVIPQYKNYVILTAISLVIVITLLTEYTFWANWLPAISAVIYGLSNYFHEDYLKSRICMAIGLTMWLTIGIVFGSIPEVISSAIGLCSLFLGMRRHLKALHPKP